MTLFLMSWWKWVCTQLILHRGYLEVFWYTWGQNTCIPKLLLSKRFSYSWWQERRWKQMNSLIWLHWFYIVSPCAAEDIEESFYNQKNMISGNDVERSLQDMFSVCSIYFSHLCLAVCFSVQAINLAKLNATVKGEIRKNIDLLGSLMTTTQTTNLDCILAAKGH